MRRSEEHRHRIFKYKIIFFIIILLAVIILIFSSGLKILLQASVFINQIFSGNKSNTSLKSVDFYGSLDVDEPPSATNSSEIIVTGSVLNYETIIFYLNDEKVKEIRVNGDNFSETIDSLEKGSNELYLIAKSKKENKSKESARFEINYIKDKPKLEITEPKDNQITSKQEITIHGQTDKEITVRINNSPVVIDASGSFQTALSLKEGDNKIEIQAEDIAGNIETKTLTVKYEKDE